MQTPACIQEWLVEKCEAHRWGTVREARSVEHSWHRHTGARFVTAGITVSIEPAKQFELVAIAPGIEPDYVAAARNAVITVLLSQSYSPVLGCRVELSDFKPHEIESSYMAFYFVTKQATELLLGTAFGSEHNIVW